MKKSLTPNDPLLLQDGFIQSDIDEGWCVVRGTDEETGLPITEDVLQLDDQLKKLADQPFFCFPLISLSDIPGVVIYNQQLVREHKGRTCAVINGYLREHQQGIYSTDVNPKPSLSGYEPELPTNTKGPFEAFFKEGIKSVIKRFPDLISWYNPDNKRLAQGIKLTFPVDQRVFAKYYFRYMPWGKETTATYYDNYDIEFTGTLLKLNIDAENNRISLARDKKGNLIYITATEKTRITLFTEFNESVGELDQESLDLFENAVDVEVIEDEFYSWYFSSEGDYQPVNMRMCGSVYNRENPGLFTRLLQSSVDFIEDCNWGRNSYNRVRLCTVRGNPSALLWCRLFPTAFSIDGLCIIPVRDGKLTVYPDTQVVKVSGLAMTPDFYRVPEGYYNLFTAMDPDRIRNVKHFRDWFEFDPNDLYWPYTSGQFTSGLRVRNLISDASIEIDGRKVIITRPKVDGDIFNRINLRWHERPEVMLELGGLIEIDETGVLNKDAERPSLKNWKVNGTGFNIRNFSAVKGLTIQVDPTCYPMKWMLKDYPFCQTPPIIVNGCLLDSYYDIMKNKKLFEQSPQILKNEVVVKPDHFANETKIGWWYDSTGDCFNHVTYNGTDHYWIDTRRSCWGAKFIPACLSIKWMDSITAMLPLVDPGIIDTVSETGLVRHYGLLFSDNVILDAVKEPKQFEKVFNSMSSVFSCGGFAPDRGCKFATIARNKLLNTDPSDTATSKIKMVYFVDDEAEEFDEFEDGKGFLQVPIDTTLGDRTAKKTRARTVGLEGLTIKEGLRPITRAEALMWINAPDYLADNNTDDDRYEHLPFKYICGRILLNTHVAVHDVIDYSIIGSYLQDEMDDCAIIRLEDKENESIMYTFNAAEFQMPVNVLGYTLILRWEMGGKYRLGEHSGGYIWQEEAVYNSDTTVVSRLANGCTLSHRVGLSFTDHALGETKPIGQHKFGIPVIRCSNDFDINELGISTVTYWTDGKFVIQGRYPGKLEELRMANRPRLIWTGDKKTSYFKYMPDITNYTFTHHNKETNTSYNVTVDKVCFGVDKLQIITEKQYDFMKKPFIALIDRRGRIICDGAKLIDVIEMKPEAFHPAFRALIPTNIRHYDFNRENRPQQRPLIVPNQFRYFNQNQPINYVELPESPVMDLEARRAFSRLLVKPLDIRKYWDNFEMKVIDGNINYLFNDFAWNGEYPIFDVDLIGLYSAPNSLKFIDGEWHNRIYWNKETKCVESGSGIMKSMNHYVASYMKGKIADMCGYTAGHYRVGYIGAVGPHTSGLKRMTDVEDYWDLQVDNGGIQE